MGKKNKKQKKKKKKKKNESPKSISTKTSSMQSTKSVRSFSEEFMLGADMENDANSVSSTKTRKRKRKRKKKAKANDAVCVQQSQPQIKISTKHNASQQQQQQQQLHHVNHAQYVNRNNHQSNALIGRSQSDSYLMHNQQSNTAYAQNVDNYHQNTSNQYIVPPYNSYTVTAVNNQQQQQNALYDNDSQIDQVMQQIDQMIDLDD